MTTLLEVFQNALVFLAGILLRLLLAVLVLAALALPMMAAIDAWMRLQRRLGARHQRRVAGLSWRTNLSYAPGHTWVRRRWSSLVVGLDDVARRIVSPARAVWLPVLGMTVRAGETAAEIDVGGRVTAIAAPVDGTVVAVNDDVRRDPSLVEEDPYGRGWLYRLAPMGTFWPGLRRDQAARDWLADESQGLVRFLEYELGTAGADGGHMTAPPAEVLDEDQWRRLTRAFLHAA